MHTLRSDHPKLLENLVRVCGTRLAVDPVELGVLAGGDLGRVNLKFDRLRQRVDDAAVDAVLDDLCSMCNTMPLVFRTEHRDTHMLQQNMAYYN
jgi:hypothetical protein